MKTYNKMFFHRHPTDVRVLNELCNDPLKPNFGLHGCLFKECMLFSFQEKLKKVHFVAVLLLGIGCLSHFQIGSSVYLPLNAKL